MLKSFKKHLALTTLFVSCSNIFTESEALQEPQDIKTLEENLTNDFKAESVEEKISAAKKTFADELDKKYANAERWAFTLANAVIWSLVASQGKLKFIKNLISWKDRQDARCGLALILNTIATHFVKHGTKSHSLKENIKPLLKLLAHSAAFGYSSTAATEGSITKMDIELIFIIFVFESIINGTVFGLSFTAKKIALHKKIKALKAELDKQDVANQEPATE